MDNWKCKYCGHIYHEEDGWIRDAIPPGTKFEDVPDNWICPLCKAPKSAFEKMPQN